MQASQQALRATDRFAGIEHLGFDAGPTTECEQLSRQHRALLAGLPDLNQRLGDRAVASHFVERQLTETVDGRKQIVEVVRNTAGQSAKCFHLLRLTGLRFTPATFELVLSAFGFQRQRVEGE